ncbi:hypothetical protein PS2_148 [Serratia phage PS2]|uniref:Uncharacterized protein n=1 Tax=Serratia phage PS2 TaxID=1481112 RepID=A0A023W4Y0_9CAUD|nr:hypothetical protein FF83_gp267 [Serratia phage PS2]AHY25394.1 hypothetical protein PS2_148 [Serratia phage PS2]
MNPWQFKDLDKEELGNLVLAIHSLGKDKLREMVMMMWAELERLELEKKQ